MKLTKQAALLAGLCIAWLALCGCEKTPITTTKTDNPQIAVELLFEKDGVKVYRFTDSGRSVYYTDARGRTEWTVNKGKAGTDHYDVETVK